jgi:hypothetical protein
VQHDGPHWEASFRRLIDPALEAEQLGELARALGSFLDHARAALNYTAFQIAHLAIRDNPALDDPALPWKERLHPESVEFPIFECSDLYRKNNRLRKFPSEYADPIEAMQPYNGGHDGLWTLHLLAAQFRHHVIHPTVIWPVDSLHRVLVDGAPLPAAALEITPRKRLEDGDVVLRFTLPTYLDPPAQVDPQIVLAIGIDHRACAGLEAMGVLNAMMADVGAVIGALEAQFFPNP